MIVPKVKFRGQLGARWYYWLRRTRSSSQIMLHGTNWLDCGSKAKFRALQYLLEMTKLGREKTIAGNAYKCPYITQVVLKATGQIVQLSRRAIICNFRFRNSEAPLSVT